MESARTYDEETPLLNDKRGRKYRMYDQVLLKPYNALFAENLELGLRGATFLLIFALPFLWHHEWDTEAGAFRDLGVFKTGAAVFLIFLFSRSVGETCSLAWGALVGICLSVGLTWILNGFFPGGYVSGEPETVFWFLAGAGTLALWVVLNINLSVNAKVFFTMSFSYHWMALLSGEKDSNYATNFELHLGKYGLCEILACLIGCLLAVLATLLPEPLWAMEKAKASSMDLCDDLGKVWDDILRFFCSDVPNIAEQEAFMVDMQVLHHEITSLEVYVGHAWWECLGRGKWQTERLMFARLSKALHMNYDRLTSVWNAVVQEEFGHYHTRVMGVLTPHVTVVVREADSLLRMCTEEVMHGGIRDEKVAAIEAAIATTKREMAALMREFRRVKVTLGLPPVSEELLDEHAFCISVSGCGRNAFEFAEDMLAYRQSTKELPAIDAKEGVFDMKVIMAPDHINRALRRFLAVILAICVGYMGHGHLIQRYDSSIAATVAIMFSNHLGSAAAENFNKFQGCVLGTTIGLIATSLFGFCEWYYIAATCLFLWGFAFASLFLYYKSAHYGNVALYMAAFGCNDFLLGCTDHFSRARAYHVTCDVVVGMTLVVLVDLVLANRRASDLAKDAIVDVWQILTSATRNLFDETSTGVREHKGMILEKVQRADLLGVEAEWEPRYWRTAWKTQLYQQAIQCFYRLRMSLSGLEYELSSGIQKDATFVRLLQMQSFQAVKNNLTQKMKQLEDLFAIFVHETKGGMPLLRDATHLLDDNLFGEMSAMQVLIKEINAMGLGNDSSAEFLNDDPASEISLIIASMSAMTGEMRGLQREILKS